MFIDPLEEEFKCSRFAVSLAPTIHMVVLIFSQLAIGWMTDKYGPRLPLILAALFAGGGLVLASQAGSLTQFYLFYGIAALTAGAQVGALPSSVIQKWFTEKRGLVLGVVASGMGAGPLIFVPLGERLINSYGWHTAYLILGIIAGALLLLAALLVSASPEKKGLKPYGAERLSPQDSSPGNHGASASITKKDKPQLQETQVWTAREALRTRTFLALCGYCLFSFLPVVLLTTHFVPFASGSPLQLNREIAALALGLIGGISIAGRIGWGSITPNVVGWKRGLIVCSSVCAVMMLWLVGTRDPLMLWIFVVVFGFFQGARTPLIPGTISYYFGMKSLGSLVGTVTAIGVIGCAIGPVLGGFLYELADESYLLAFIACAICWALGILFASMLKMPQKNET